ncbi:MAG: uroporphyrinogen-III C-methyltransferase [Proteobacteria bacterium]|nr:MAG: uroporphyrinogen-III C-methyltransferase [Pseudomonadota bacterium]
MRYLPIFLHIRDRHCLVVGGGEVAARKANLLLEAGARVTVVSPVLGATLSRMAASGTIEHLPARFEPAHLADRRLVIAATDDEAVNRQVAELAAARNLPVNVADRPDAGDFIVPSVIDRSPVTVAVSSGGASPVLARLLRARLESLIPSAYGRLALLIEKFRERVKKRLPAPARRRFWDQVLQGHIAEMVFAGNVAQAENALQRAIEDGDPSDRGVGEVYLVGAGPGDPDLLTFRALRLLQQADVVLYDRLVSEPILAMVRKGADKIYVGKERANHAVPQDRINSLLLELAKEGKRVLRLKGGDPFIFGRGGEEIEDLMREGVPFQVVPGITAASGCAAYSGIPLTHRDYSQSCVFVTGHVKSGGVDLNWTQLCQPNQTVVVYMGLNGLDTLCRELIRHGTPPDMPAALVERGTTREQRVFTGTLETLPGAVRDENVGAPTLIIVGNVVRLRGELNWYKRETMNETDTA